MWKDIWIFTQPALLSLLLPRNPSAYCLLSALMSNTVRTSPLSKLPVSLILLLNIFTHVVLTPDPVKDSDKDLDWPGAARKNTLGMIHDVCTGEGVLKEIIDCMSVTVTMRGLSVKMLNFLRTTFRYIDP